MEFVTGNLVIMALIITLARGIEIPPEAVLAIIHVESGGNPYATAYNQTYGALSHQTPRPANCCPNTETVHQKTAWGLMQVMGATARHAGFSGWLTELTEPTLNVRLGITYLGELAKRFREKHGLDGVIAAYNAGNPRKNADGKFRNQAYVNKVKNLLPRYAKIVAEEEEAALASIVEDDVPTKNSTAEPETVIMEKEAAMSSAIANGEADVENNGAEGEIVVAGKEELAARLASQSRKDLVAMAKELNVEVPARAKAEDIVTLLLGVIGTEENFKAAVTTLPGASQGSGESNSAKS